MSNEKNFAGIPVFVSQLLNISVPSLCCLSPSLHTSESGQLTMEQDNTAPTLQPCRAHTQAQPQAQPQAQALIYTWAWIQKYTLVQNQITPPPTHTHIIGD